MACPVTQKGLAWGPPLQLSLDQFAWPLLAGICMNPVVQNTRKRSKALCVWIVLPSYVCSAGIHWLLPYTHSQSLWDRLFPLLATFTQILSLGCPCWASLALVTSYKCPHWWTATSRWEQSKADSTSSQGEVPRRLLTCAQPPRCHFCHFQVLFQLGLGKLGFEGTRGSVLPWQVDTAS